MNPTSKNPAAVSLGRRGGKAGRGQSKRRSAEHYARLSKLGLEAQAQKRRFARETKQLTPNQTAEKMNP